VPEYFRQTARIGFRTWRESDLDLAFALWGDPAVTRFIDARARLSRKDVAGRLAEEIRCDAEHPERR
jgi:RimJ/RimL family protein N-acetyltransferase